MSNSLRTAANRLNATRSTGPRSPAGKARTAQNAKRHGLAVAVESVPELTHEIEKLTHLIAGNVAQGEQLTLARAVAAAQIDLQRIRQARQRLIEDVENRLPTSPKACDLINFILALKGKRTVRNTDRLLRTGRIVSEENEHGQPLTWIERFAAIDKELEKLERYERRAFSRRKRAIRAFYERQEAKSLILAGDVGILAEQSHSNERRPLTHGGRPEA